MVSATQCDVCGAGHGGDADQWAVLAAPHDGAAPRQSLICPQCADMITALLASRGADLQPARGPAARMRSPLETVRAYYELFRAPSREALDQLVTDDFALDDRPINWHVRGKEDLWRYLDRPRERTAAENEGSFVVEAYVGSGNAGAARWRWRAQAGTAALFGLPPAKKPTDVNGVAMVTFHEGKLASLTEYWDAAAMLRDFGADVPEGNLPAPSSARPRASARRSKRTSRT